MLRNRELDPNVFAPDGNRKRGFRCGPCIKHKKGCKGSPPVCDTCVRRNSAHKCDFGPEAIEEAHKSSRKKQTIPRLATSSSVEVTESSDEPVSSPLQRKRKATSPIPRRRTNTIGRQIDAVPRVPPVSTALISFAPSSLEVSYLMSDSASQAASIYRTNSTTHYQQQASVKRINKQKRSMESLSEEEISQARNPLTRQFIKTYHAPFSRNLLPMLVEIVNGMIDNRVSDDKNAVYAEVQGFFTYVWSLVLSCITAQEHQKLVAKQLTSNTPLATKGPVTEREVEEFFFAYMCILSSKMKSETVWDESAQARAKKWYVEIVDRNWLYLRDCLHWHRQNGFEYEKRADWLIEWLQEKAVDGDA